MINLGYEGLLEIESELLESA